MGLVQKCTEDSGVLIPRSYKVVSEPYRLQVVTQLEWPLVEKLQNLFYITRKINCSLLILVIYLQLLHSNSFSLHHFIMLNGSSLPWKFLQMVNTFLTNTFKTKRHGANKEASSSKTVSRTCDVSQAIQFKLPRLILCTESFHQIKNLDRVERCIVLYRMFSVGTSYVDLMILCTTFALMGRLLFSQLSIFLILCFCFFSNNPLDNLTFQCTMEMKDELVLQNFGQLKTLGNEANLKIDSLYLSIHLSFVRQLSFQPLRISGTRFLLRGVVCNIPKCCYQNKINKVIVVLDFLKFERVLLLYLNF